MFDKRAVDATAKVFMSGHSQAVRLPAAFRFDTDEVFIHRDPITGDVVLSTRPSSWEGLFAALDIAKAPDDFLSEDERRQVDSSRDPLDLEER